MEGWAYGGPCGLRRKPTNHVFWCTCAEDYTHIKPVWKLTTTDKEKTALSSMLDTFTN
ncbi:hypothetical protein [Streptomyces sp. NPDC002550]